MLYRSCAITLSMLIVLFNRNAEAQTCTPGGQYTVTTWSQLQSALACYANDCAGSCLTCSGGCPTEIIIPVGTTINVTDVTGSVIINQNHPGLTLTINGTLKSFGTFTGLIVDLLDSTNVTVRGSGEITTDDTPAPLVSISTAIGIADCTNVTVQGLTIRNVNRMVNAAFEASNGITLQNLTGVNMRDYGVWVGSNDAFDQNITITNCSVDGTINDHGFRVYGDNVTITDCEAFNVAKTGFWVVEGTNAVIDGFVTDKEFRVGPTTQAKTTASACVAFRCATCQQPSSTVAETPPR